MRPHRPFHVIVRTASQWHGAIDAPSRKAALAMAQAMFRRGDMDPTQSQFVSAVACRRRVSSGAWSTFERRFKPIDGPDGALDWRFNQLPDDVDVHLVWTILDCDGRLHVGPGYHLVNRVDYLLCSVPWTDLDAAQPPYRNA